MRNKNLTIAKIGWFCKGTIVPIVLVFSLFWSYVRGYCFFSSKSSNTDLVCSLNWKAGLILVISYSIVKLFSPLLDFNTIFKRFFVTLLLYSFSFAIIAFPFWLVSFFQHFGANTFLHISAIILTVEIIFKNYNRQTAT